MNSIFDFSKEVYSIIQDSIQSVDTVSDMFKGDGLLACAFIALCNTLLLFLISYKFLQIMQQSGYEGFGYFKWLRRRDNVYLLRLGTISMLSLLSYLLFIISLSFIDGDWVIYTGFIFYVAFVFGYFKADKKHIRKVPINFTARMERLIIVYFIVLAVCNFALLVLANLLAYAFRFNAVLVRVRYAVICVLPVCVPFFVLLAYYITKPFENARQRKYIKKCTETLCSHPDLVRIGITGSYGKTSVKEILKTLLEERYNVLATPSSYNTPMGICKTVGNLKDGHNVFIAEMGARHVGDISTLAEIVKPDYAIINGIVGQHLETFGTLAAVQQTKYELVESMSKGVVAYTIDNDSTSVLFSDCKIKSVPAGLDISKKPAVYAENIELSENGSEFTLCIYGRKMRCHTVLLGSHNVSNICLAVAIAAEMGLSDEEICAGIARIKPVNHRLECTKNSDGVVIIDDSYNANTRGIDAAMEVLSSFKGRKIVVTPGLVELGREEDLENYRLGKKMASVCDIAVLVGKSATYRIQDGLIDGGFDNSKILIVKELEAAKRKLKKIVKAGDIVLFENDLPDKFS